MNWRDVRQDVWQFFDPAEAGSAYDRTETLWRSLSVPPPVILSLVSLQTGEHFVSLITPPEVSQFVQNFIASLMEEAGGDRIDDQDKKRVVIAKAVEGFRVMLNRRKIKNAFKAWKN